MAGARSAPARGALSYRGRTMLMGKKPAFALAGLVVVGLALSGCESCGSCRGRRLQGTNVPGATASTASPGSGMQVKTTSPNPFDTAARPVAPGNTTPGGSDPASSIRPASAGGMGYPNPSTTNSSMPATGSFNPATGNGGAALAPSSGMTGAGRVQTAGWPATPGTGNDPSAAAGQQAPKPVWPSSPSTSTSGMYPGSTSASYPSTQYPAPSQPVTRESN